MEAVDQIDFKDPMERAISFALAAHTGQKRIFLNSCKENESNFKIAFIIHPMDVAKRIWNWGAATTLRMQGAILHDVVEDTNYSVNMIHQFFNVKVAILVQELTFPENPEWDHATKREKKLEYMDSFHHKSIDALVIKISDRLCNVEDFALTSPQYAPKYFSKAWPLFEAMSDREDEMKNKLGADVLNAILRDYRKVKDAMRSLAAS